MSVPSQEAEELVLLVTLTALALSRDKSIFELELAGSFLTAVADQLFLLAVVLDEEEVQREIQEENKKEKAVDERLAALEKAVKELKGLCEKAATKK